VVITFGAEDAREALDRVVDPEIPVLTIAELGILRGVEQTADGAVRVTITPTYSGCPAMDAIRDDIRTALAADGFRDISIEVVLSPAWTTDWISGAGRRKLADFGIAPPARAGQGGPVPVTIRPRPPAVCCPRCGSEHTREVSRFGSTACKAQYRCDVCLEPFDYFKSL
jgi:ring-1,2-phenylacetyl-CoA epoxidase subunit PaaD